MFVCVSKQECLLVCAHHLLDGCGTTATASPPPNRPFPITSTLLSCHSLNLTFHNQNPVISFSNPLSQFFPIIYFPSTPCPSGVLPPPNLYHLLTTRNNRYRPPSLNLFLSNSQFYSFYHSFTFSFRLAIYLSISQILLQTYKFILYDFVLINWGNAYCFYCFKSKTSNRAE